MKKKYFILICLISLFSVSLDRLFKLLAEKNFFYPPISLIGDLFSLNFAANKFISFSLPIGGAGLIIGIILALIWLAYYLVYSFKKGEQKKAAAILLILFGAASNLFDRFKYGYVIDYFDLKYFTVFNLADAMIVFGTIILAWLLSKKGKVTSSHLTI
jgi:signal peptidase II